MAAFTRIYNAFAGVTIHLGEHAVQAEAIAFTLSEDATGTRGIAGTIVAPTPEVASQWYSELRGGFAIALRGKDSDEKPVQLLLHGVHFHRPPMYTMGIQDPDGQLKLNFGAARYIPWTKVAA